MEELVAKREGVGSEGEGERKGWREVYIVESERIRG